MNNKTTFTSINNNDWSELAYFLNKAEIKSNMKMAVIMNEDTADAFLKNVQKVEFKSENENEKGMIMTSHGYGVLFRIVPRKYFDIPYGESLIMPEENAITLTFVAEVSD